MKKTIVSTLLSLTIVITASTVGGFALAPDGSYISRSSSTLAPDSTYVGE